MSEESEEFIWLLGEDYDCETCGRTYNEVGLELWDEDTGVYQLYIRVGCYGGDSVMSTDPEWGERAANIVQEALFYPKFNETNAEKLRSKLKLIK
jgi:hypothetical protein